MTTLSHDYKSALKIEISKETKLILFSYLIGEISQTSRSR